MLTLDQQVELQRLGDIFEEINEKQYSPDDIIAKISSGINDWETKRLIKKSALEAQRAIAREHMNKWVDEVVRPVLRRFLPGNEAKISEDGSLHIKTGGHWSGFTLVSSFDNINTDNPTWRGFHQIYTNPHYTQKELNSFNEVFSKWVVDVLKSLKLK